jgi:sugar phosphate isomerase/epimerase
MIFDTARPKDHRLINTPARLIATYFTLAGDVIPLGGNMASPHSLRARAEAASRAGDVGLGMAVDDLVQAIDRHGFAGIRAILGDNGIEYLEFEALLDWFSDGERRANSDRTRKLLLDSAAKLGAFQIKAIGDMSGGDWSNGHMATDFASLCDEADGAGCQVAIEILPISNIRDLQTAINIVSTAGAANGGLLLDIWHMARGGIAYEDFATLPPQYIKHIELNDADAVQVGSLFEDMILRRRLPGEGALDVPRFLRCVQATGYQGLYGVEIVSGAQRALPLADAARLSFDASMAQFAFIDG